MRSRMPMLAPLLQRQVEAAEPSCAPVSSSDEAKRSPLLIGEKRTAATMLPRFFDKATAAVLLWFEQPKVLLLSPIQVTFGVCASLLGYQVTGTWVKNAFSRDYVVIGSMMSALVALTAALLQIPFKYVASHSGKAPLMLVGCSAFMALSVLVLVAPETLHASAQTWGLLFACYFLQGVGRACYEGTNKALYADFFPNNTSAAFSNIVLANGFASATSFFVFPSLHKDAMATTAIVCASVAIICYMFAEYLHRRV
mmetsp:Transcript_11245/g.26011  ORF Transcript_11245/g.26011 Transcript_11245/m.26011 type:complete len:255 (-) Transcript_11245:291-1055(-)